ncbi:unnamed protein product [Chondrus crispus]|uniref:NAD(P)H-hydrate epimerase n=1 Tax=Chondrus crispus TaxID=2769 RepID=R7Q1H5_CHOCR|nr:unnamed protein product [Chondrus crispus]CDF32447.1 unnamed protein product [Chondrus crispus]|eukprot:XP_005712112.1 unnamed protein product [Chondrus crispus]
MEVDKSSKQGDNSKPRQTHISPELANQAINDAITYSGGDVVVMARTCASGFCDALQQCYGSEEISDVFIACGSGLNGLIGLQVAVELQKKGYAPEVYAAEQSKHANFRSVCDEAGIDLHDFIPSTLEFYYDIVVDALLGTGFDGGDIRQQYWTVYEMLISTRLAIVSLDVPSGWDLSTGPRKIDVTADSFIKPEVLVSLGAPKLGSKVFAGGYHFIAGRHLPQSYFLEKGISVPAFPGEESNCVLMSSNPFRFEGANGETYGRPGQFNATLYTKNPTREWVDVDKHDDLWDELD